MSSTSDTRWKARYVKTLNFITVICILIGCFIHIGGGLLFGFVRNVGSSETSSSASSTTGIFTEVSCDMDLGNLILQYGDEYSYEIKDYPANATPEIELKNDKLVIKQKSKSNNWKNNGAFKNCQVIVTIPDDGALNKADLKLNLGELEAKELSIDDLKIDLKLGGASFKDCKFDKVNIDAKMGSVSLKDCDFTTGNFEASMGSISLESCNFDSADCSSEMGSINVNGRYSKLEADCDLGSINVKSDLNDTRFDLSTDAGSITVNGSGYGRSYKN
ncbi:MAG: DUF4097 domain-containing protein [Lachnospiraceae bacterium]|nr:DUF4097 domain-containing protein [Lachnospiraceae bacterium]